MKRGLAALAALLLVTVGSPTSAQERLCFGRRPTITAVGDGGLVTGTPGPDVIAVRGGSFRVKGLGGDDRICGGNGNDRLFGGAGRDRIESARPGWQEVASGGPGNDVLFGGSADDECDGSWKLKGGPGHDRLATRPGTICLAMLGGLGDDTVLAKGASVPAIGGPGDDRMVGNGTLEGGAGNDSMAGRGLALLVFDDPAGVRVDAEQEKSFGPGEGSDTFDGIDQFVLTDGPDVFVGDGTASVVHAGGDDDVLGGGGGSDMLDGGSGDDEVDGGAGDDGLNAAPGDDVVLGGDGDDRLAGTVSRRGTPTTEYHGGAGRDHLTLSFGGSPLAREQVTVDLAGPSSAGGVPLVVTEIEDARVNSRGRVDVYGDEGPNRLSANGADVVLSGRGGGDLVEPQVGAPTSIDGGDGVDTARLGPYSVTVDLAAGTFTFRVPWETASTIAGIENLEGSSEPDTLLGDEGPNSILGGWYEDTLEGRGGDDFLDGGDHADTLDGGDGTDECVNGETVRNCE